MAVLAGLTTLQTAAEMSRRDDAPMGAFARGNAQAFDELYARYREPLMGYLFRHCGDESIAGEMFQNVWLRVVAAKSGFARRGRFRSWLFTLAHHPLVDYYRRAENRYRREQFDDTADLSPSILRNVQVARELSELEKVLRQLPREQQAVFYLREEGGLSIREIAEVEEISLEAAKSRLRYAYRKLRGGLAQHHDEESS